jgi:hypothetical protein
MSGRSGNQSNQGHDVEARLSKLKNIMGFQLDKNVGNDLMFARLREETDANSNKVKEDRLVMNALKSITPLPDDPRLRIEALKDIAMKIFQQLIPGFDGRIIYLTTGKQQGQPIPLIKVRMDKPDKAIDLRKAYVEKKNNLGI